MWQGEQKTFGKTKLSNSQAEPDIKPDVEPVDLYKPDN